MIYVDGIHTKTVIKKPLRKCAFSCGYIQYEKIFFFFYGSSLFCVGKLESRDTIQVIAKLPGDRQSS